MLGLGIITWHSIGDEAVAKVAVFVEAPLLACTQFLPMTRCFSSLSPLSEAGYSPVRLDIGSKVAKLSGVLSFFFICDGKRSVSFLPRRLFPPIFWLTP